MITLENVYKSYGAIKVLEGMSLQVEAGKSLCILGKSGCGKSTVLKLIALMTRPDKGGLYIDGRDMTRTTETEIEAVRRGSIAYSFQEPLLIPYVTALENITLVLGTPKDHAIQMLSQLGLGERLNQSPPRLSGGEKKRVDIARAILKGSSILVADEPLSNLDPDSGSKVIELLTKHASDGGVLVYSSVEPAQANFADEVVEMKAS
jgi:putative ABC transport system ATP-binding protein